MKKFLSYAMYASLLVIALSFTSCQEEFEELPDGNEQETIVASSSTAKLIEHTVSNDGSFDNIVDKASCFAVNFPYTVNVNGLDITIDSIEDLQLVEDVIDKLDSDTDILEILFPITITLADFTEIKIETKEALIKLAKECVEGGKDDDIECIDFVYPITLYTFDINKQETGNVTVNNDKELKRFFAGLDKNDLIGIDFPITLKLYDGTEIVVDSNAELAAAIESAKDTCDEDDDNDCNDDDFTKERLDKYLVKCPWLVKEVKRNDQDQTGQYFEYLMNFTEDGGVTVKDREGNILNGTWATRVSDHKVLLKLEFDVLVDFTLEWFVYEIGEGKIKLYASDKDKIIMRKACGIVDHNPDTLREILKECAWIIKKVKVDGVNINRMLGFEFKFKPEGVVVLGKDTYESTGSWEITKNAQGRLVMAITMGNEPGVSFEWLLSDLKDNRLKFSIEGTGYELLLERNCDNDENDGDVTEIRRFLNDTSWKVAKFVENEDPGTEAYAGYTFNFKMDGTIIVLNPNKEEADKGTWYVYRNSKNTLELIITFGAQSEFYALANDYRIREAKENRLDLKHENDGGGYDYLVLEKSE